MLLINVRLLIVKHLILSYLAFCFFFIFIHNENQYGDYHIIITKIHIIVVSGSNLIFKKFMGYRHTCVQRRRCVYSSVKKQLIEF